MKRFLDLALSGALLVVSSPLLVCCLLAVKLDSKGPALFKQRRLGRGGRPFMVFKLRTMVHGAETLGAGLYTERRDPRFTRSGLLLRRWSLDELPQLLNVIRGDMSLVGPRPLPEEIVSRHPDEFARILKVRPGLTGLSQISGRSALTRTERLELDIEYAERHTLLLDLGILLKTLPVVVTGYGQENYVEEREVER